MSTGYLFTSESVSEGHPDKVADQISDAVLDALIAQDKRSRVACETMVKTGVAIVAGEVTTEAWVDLEELVRGVITDIGYTSSNVGFDGRTCGVINIIGKQSPDIAHGRRPQEPGRTGRRRPGPDVRLRQQRDAEPDAGADLLRAQAGRTPGRGAQEQAAAVAAPGRQVAGHLPLRGRQGRRPRRRRAVDPARPGSRARRTCRKR